MKEQKEQKKQCPKCKGTGWHGKRASDSAPKPCKICWGSGEVD